MAFPANKRTVIQIDPDSAARLRRLLTRAISSMLRASLDHSDAARIQWQTASQKYRERWAQGDLDAVVPIMSDLLAWLRRAGIDPFRDPEVAALCNDPAVKRIRGLAQPIDLLDTFRQVAGAVGR
jgi:hypothetical protein